MFKFLLTILLLVSLSGILDAQSTSNPCVKSTEGKDFWFGFLESRHQQAGHYLELTLTSTFSCQFKMYIGKSTVPYLVGALQPNTPWRYQPPWSLIEPLGSETIEQKAIHIESDQPMNIFAMNWSPNSADAAVIFPVEAIGNEYYAVCYEPHINEGAGGVPGNGKNSEFVVVASEDNTQITINPTKITDQLRPANVPFSITLSKGELYQVQSMNHANLAGQGDLTGSYIKSDKPVAFYSGSWSTTIPASSTSAYDHLYEQIPPVRSWGRKFVTVPLKGRSVDAFRILTSENKTNIRIGTNTPIVLDKGNFYEFTLNQDQPTVIESDHPILLAQYMVSNSVDKPANAATWDGDPLMLIVSPVDQTRETVTFVAYDTPEIVSKFFVNVVTRIEYMSNILLDSQPITFTVLPNSEYAYAQIAIAKGNHNLDSNVPGRGFIAYVYGYGGVESYGYGVGFNLSIKLDLGGDIHFSKDTLLLCKGQAKIVDAGSHFSKFIWSTGDTTQTIFVSKAGYTKVTASTSEGCILSDSIYTYLSNPVVKLGNDTTICNPKTLKLDAGAGYTSYHWNTKDSVRSITITKAGIYSVLSMNKYDCPAGDTLLVNFTNKPKINLLGLDSLVCGSKVSTLNITADKGQYQLKSINPLVSVKGLMATVPQFGTYPFTFTATDQYTCASDTVFTIGFHEIPVLNLGSDTTICNPKHIVLDAGAGMKSYLWSTKDTIRTINVRNQGSYGVLIRNKYGCSNQDNIQVNFVNNPKMDLSRLDTLFCGIKSAFANISVDKGKYILTSMDPAVTISGLSVNATKFATFPFNYKVTDQFSCVSDTSFTMGFHKIPTAQISVDDTTCYGYNLNARYTGDADLTLAKFTWIFAKDTVFEGIGKDQIQVKIGYDKNKRDLFLNVNERGCSNQSNIKEINVIPDLNFTVIDSLLCQPEDFKFSATNTENVVDYEWNWGDGTIEHLSQTAAHHYAKAGYYNVSVTATTDKKCINTIKKENLVYAAPIPTMDFSIKENTCLELGAQSLFYTGSADEKDHYNWDLSEFLAQEVVKVPGDTKGPLIFDVKSKPAVNIALQVTSKYGCISDKKALRILHVPRFSLSMPDSSGCIPFYANLKAITGDPVDQVSYKWNFGDGEKTSGTNVTHTYPIPDKKYDITLFAESVTTGCKDTLFKPGLIKVHPRPKAGFAFENKIYTNADAAVQFVNQSDGADHFVWDFGDGKQALTSDPAHKYDVVGQRRVLLRAINVFECSDTISNLVLIALQQIYTPNAIAPNAANVMDREFRLYSNGVNEMDYHLTIMSRWGDVVFECRNEIRGWDGKMNNGSFAPAGNYIWILHFVDFLGNPHEQKGIVTLIF